MANEWQDIATAPKGQWIQAWRAGYRAPVTAMFCGSGYSGWVVNGEDVFSDEAPTHWMPLPAPPIESDDEPTDPDPTDLFVDNGGEGG